MWPAENVGVSKNSGFSLQIIHFNRVFHYKPSIWGTPIFGNTHVVILWFFLAAAIYTNFVKCSQNTAEEMDKGPQGKEPYPMHHFLVEIMLHQQWNVDFLYSIVYNDIKLIYK